MKSKFKIMAFCGMFLSMDVTAIFAQTMVKVNPNTSYQTMKGWGGSLCWWANMAGGFSQAKVDTICKWIASPNELNMNVFRFNIGGGDNPSHHHMRTDGGNMPGYKASATAAYDWSKDANQRKILLKLNSLRNDVINEAFSNSPPYWMTKSSCSAGNSDGSDNLKDDQYVAFADYLTEVVKYYKEKQGITFSTLEPFNEPLNTWAAFNKQEGCHFSIGAQKKLIPQVYQKLKDKNMLGYCGISAMDNADVNGCVNTINTYVADGTIMSKIVQINTHTYSGSNRAGLYNLATKYKKELWQSESGPYGVSATGINNYLVMAQRILTDLRDMKPVVWVDWQLMSDNDPKWGLIPADYTNQTFRKDKSYFVRMQCSRFIKPGYTIINSDQTNTIAALSPSENELVVVVCNQQSTTQSLVLDLTLFPKIGAPIAYRTSVSEDCKRITPNNLQNKKLAYSAPAASLTTFVIPLNTVITGFDMEEREGYTNCYPNPFQEEIQLKSEGDFEFTISDMSGNKVNEGNGHDVVKLGKELPIGMYVVKIKTIKGSQLFKISKN